MTFWCSSNKEYLSLFQIKIIGLSLEILLTPYLFAQLIWLWMAEWYATGNLERSSLKVRNSWGILSATVEQLVNPPKSASPNTIQWITLYSLLTNTCCVRYCAFFPKSVTTILTLFSKQAGIIFGVNINRFLKMELYEINIEFLNVIQVILSVYSV